ncbi:MAG: hypothetical protein M1834_007509 [Cirrosporium novae-zelandiae]|nr:MAG: hypothetical protein M1834_007509 [Cirrosporium novae-zelandiae]
MSLANNNNNQTEATKPSKSLLLHDTKDLRFESRTVEPPKGTEVQVAIKATGICGSDLHYYSEGRNGDFLVRAPLCLGHESAGVVVAVGPEVTNLKQGDRVALEVGMPCRTCNLCQKGRYNLCQKLLFRSSAKVFPHIDGTLTELLNHPSDLCHRIPDEVSFDQGALIEPLAVCLHAMRRSKPESGSSALVMGAGAVGLLTAMLLSVHGIVDIVIADIDSQRLKIAEALIPGIHTITLPTKPPSPSSPTIEEKLKNAQDSATLLKGNNREFGFDAVYECTGVEPCVQSSIYASTPGGKLILIGMGRPIQTLPLGAAALREVDIIGVFRYANTYPAAIRLMASGKLAGIEKLVTHRKSLEEGREAFELAKAGKDEQGQPVVKVIIESN